MRFIFMPVVIEPVFSGVIDNEAGLSRVCIVGVASAKHRDALILKRVAAFVAVLYRADGLR